jgi:hypothetical protein
MPGYFRVARTYPLFNVTLQSRRVYPAKPRFDPVEAAGCKCLIGTQEMSMAVAAMAQVGRFNPNRV